jgi:hypothetical protein
MRQTIAILIDSYRELNSRRMFWITLGLSALVVSILLMIGLNDEHELTILWWDTPMELPESIDLETLLKTVFISVGISFWLTWAATILALISTAGIVPDFISGGAIDLLLSRPIGRVRLFITKYLGGLLFVALQVTAFSAGAFIIIGMRAGAWEPGLFLAVPLVVMFFSYLFCVCSLVGLLTRSTVAALLLTLLFWLLLFGLNFTDGILAMPRVANEVYVEKLEARLATLEEAQVQDGRELEEVREELDGALADRAQWRKWHGLIVAVKTVLPKTGETIELLNRWLIRAAALQPDEETQNQQQNPFLSPDMFAAGVRPHEVMERLEQVYRERSVLWVLGTSLVFEVVILGIGCWIFARRDF